jgi:hypothetical protein
MAAIRGIESMATVSGVVDEVRRPESRERTGVRGSE